MATKQFDHADFCALWVEIIDAIDSEIQEGAEIALRGVHDELFPKCTAC